MKAILQARHQLTFENFLQYPELEIAEGQITFLLGESGSGKSTLLKLFNGTLSPTHGEVLYRGKTVSELAMLERRRRILLVGQTVSFFENHDIAGNFAAFAAVRGLPIPTPEEQRQLLHICCGDFPLTANCALLSGGERQRVFLALMLYFAQEILLLDEPTAALDGETAEKVTASLINYCRVKQLTCLIVSHSSKLAEQFADNTIKLLPRRPKEADANE